MLLAQLVVVHIMRWRHLQRTGTELALHVLIEDHRDLATDQRHFNLHAFQVGITLILGMNCHCRITQDRLRTCGGDGHILLAVRVVGHHPIADVVELGVHLLVDHFLVAHCGQRDGIPVHHAQATIDQSFLIQVDEHVDDRIAQVVLHGEPRAVPITAGTELLQLLEDHPTVLLLPREGMLQEFLPTDRALLDPLFRQQPHHLCFRGDARMIGAGYPACVLALHPRTAHQYVLDGVVQHVPHVQHTGHVRRRDHHGVWLAIIRHTAEVALFHPVGIPLGLAGGGFEALWDLGRGHAWKMRPQR